MQIFFLKNAIFIKFTLCHTLSSRYLCYFYGFIYRVGHIFPLIALINTDFSCFRAIHEIRGYAVDSSRFAFFAYSIILVEEFPEI
jgi:hypothetical protein